VDPSTTLRVVDGIEQYLIDHHHASVKEIVGTVA
jgi:hypothetical protein